MDGFQRYDLLTKPGNIIFPFTDFRSRVAEIVFSGSSYNEVKYKLENADRALNIETLGAAWKENLY